MPVEKGESRNYIVPKQLSGYHKDWNSAEYIEKKGIFKDHLPEIKGQLETREKTIYEIIFDYDLYYSFVKKELIAFCEPTEPDWYKNTISSKSSIHKESADDRLKQQGKDSYEEIKQLLDEGELKKNIRIQFSINPHKLDRLLKKHHYQSPHSKEEKFHINNKHRYEGLVTGMNKRQPIKRILKDLHMDSETYKKIATSKNFAQYVEESGLKKNNINYFDYKKKSRETKPKVKKEKIKQETVTPKTEFTKIRTSYTWSNQEELFKIIEENRVARLNLSTAKKLW